VFSAGKHWDSAGCHDSCPLSSVHTDRTWLFIFSISSTFQRIFLRFQNFLDEMKQRKDAISRAKAGRQEIKKSLSNAYLLVLPFCLIVSGRRKYWNTLSQQVNEAFFFSLHNKKHFCRSFNVRERPESFHSERFLCKFIC
jgi:hypothetical protein